MSTKPILFNTEMVQAILDGRKTVTRRKIDAKSVEAVLNSPARIGNPELLDRQFIERLCTAPCEAGDILWVRETWHKDAGRYMYKADYSDAKQFFCADKEVKIRWSNCIHMPKTAARLFLRVKSVRAERLQDITHEQCAKEGLTETQKSVLNKDEYWYWFMNLWNSTIKPADLPLYGWDANPWVWVIEFERCERPEDFLKEDASHEQ